MQGIRMSAIVLLLLGLVCAGCGHRASGSIGVGGNFMFHLHNTHTTQTHGPLADNRLDGPAALDERRL